MVLIIPVFRVIGGGTVLHVNLNKTAEHNML